LVNEQAAQAFRRLLQPAGKAESQNARGALTPPRIVPALRPLQDMRAECLQHRHIAGVTAAADGNAVDASFIVLGIVGTPSSAE
jgi:hypothetical protein